MGEGAARPGTEGLFDLLGLEQATHPAEQPRQPEDGESAAEALADNPSHVVGPVERCARSRAPRGQGPSPSAQRVEGEGPVALRTPLRPHHVDHLSSNPGKLAANDPTTPPASPRDARPRPKTSTRTAWTGQRRSPWTARDGGLRVRLRP